MLQRLTLAGFVLIGAFVSAQSVPQPDPPVRTWKAAWITHPTAPLREPIVLHFRRPLSLAAVPASYPVRVSADNRFVLFVNGKRVGDGPARGDLTHWRYERFDLAPLLKPGQNLIAATVWNFGVYAPIAQISDRTAFLLESEAAGEMGISTPDGWQVEEERGHKVLDRSSVTLREYFASGPGEEIDAAKYGWNWQDAVVVAGAWVPPGDPLRDSIFQGANKGHSAGVQGDNAWDLVEDLLPHTEYAPTEAGTAVRSELPALKVFPAARATVPVGTHVHLLLDRKSLTTAYPQLTVSGGKGARVVLTYSEALYDKAGHKGDRDEVGDRIARGLKDSFLPDGGELRRFQPLWWRTWRYLDLDIQTAGDPLTLEGLTAQFTAYPFEERARMQTGEPDLDKIWEISWRTARLDAHETYMDTPYYEQLQYIGDTRVQALISYAVAGDDRLARQAIAAFDQSRSADGITRSRYPSSLAQTIPTFSLLWIGMVHDYWMYRPDPEPARAALTGTRAVLNWYAGYEQPDGLLRELPEWSFVDWVSTGTIPTYSAAGESCVTTLEYLGALEEAADLERGLGDAQIGASYQVRAGRVRQGLAGKCWSSERGLVADNPDLKNFNQQANILAVLYNVVPKDRQQAVLGKMLAIEPGTAPDGILSASYYFRFYLARALDHAGMGDEYLHSLDPWRKLLPLHFSTWPEIPGDTRSDSHAWTSHPIYDLLTLVAGIEPASPGFATVRIAPHLGALPGLTARFPHPAGEIAVEYHWEAGGLDASITLPGKLEGTFELNGKSWPLKAGANRVHVPSN
jgi:hypothetical protein